MLGTIIKKEIIGHILSYRFMVTFILFFSLILISIFILTNDYQTRLDSYKASVSSHKEEINKIKAIKDPNQACAELLYNQGLYADRAPKSLSILAKGLEDNIPEEVHTAWWQPSTRKLNKELYRNPIFALFTTPDFLYIVNIILSLLSLLFVFDTICGEKENGTLKLMLSNSLPRDIILLGKWIGGYITLIAPFLVAVISGIIYLYFRKVILFDIEILSRIGLIILTSLIYISIFFTLGIFISTITRKSSTALLLGLFIWVIWILVIPNLAPVISRISMPIPTIQKINAEKQAINKEIEIKKRRISRTMIGYGKEAEELKEELDEERKKRIGKLDKFYEDKLEGQVNICKILSRISPSASFIYTSTALAQTGTGQYKIFKQAYKRFQDEFRAYGDPLGKKRRKKELKENWFHEEELPTLQITKVSIAQDFPLILFDLLLLVVYNALFFMGGYLFFLRYDVR
ncbi:MAG: ABC transporter permease subunit [Candidatus Omnitrophica bacterium]|nr:ABC transporter permease subunit [Candidatus Omnitrophota bacterium]